MDMLFDSRNCSYRTVNGLSYVSCTVCLRWPQAGGVCGLPAGSTFERVCVGDELMSVLDGPTGQLVPGGGNVTSPWASGRSYCQAVRWAENDFRPQALYFSVKVPGSGKCVRQPGQSLSATIQVGVWLTWVGRVYKCEISSGALAYCARDVSSRALGVIQEPMRYLLG